MPTNEAALAVVISDLEGPEVAVQGQADEPGRIAPLEAGEAAHPPLDSRRPETNIFRIPTTATPLHLCHLIDFTLIFVVLSPK